MAAFRIDGHNLEGINEELEDIQGQNTDDDDDSGSDNESEDWEDLDWEMASEEDDVDEVVITPEPHKLVRNGCNSHLLKCAIKDALQSVPGLSKITKKVNDIVNFFHRSNFWYAKLRERTNGLGILTPCTTRWNSLYHCLKRIFKSRPEIVRDLI